jgi:uncharacterized membrane protein SirB2
VIGLFLMCVLQIHCTLFRDSIPHLLASVVVFPGIIMAVLLLSWTFRRAAAWQTIYRVVLLIAVGMLAMLFLMVADLRMPGLQQRVFIFPVPIVAFDHRSQVSSINCLSNSCTGQIAYTDQKF